MTNYREQAVKDVAEAVEDDVQFIDAYAESANGDDDYGQAIAYAVAQREARLRLEEALRRTRCDLQRIAERVSTLQNSSAMDCLGIAMTEVDAALNEVRR